MRELQSSLFGTVFLLVVHRPTDAALVQDLAAAMLLGALAEPTVAGLASLLGAARLVPVSARPVQLK